MNASVKKQDALVDYKMKKEVTKKRVLKRLYRWCRHGCGHKLVGMHLEDRVYGYKCVKCGHVHTREELIEFWDGKNGG